MSLRRVVLGRAERIGDSFCLMCPVVRLENLSFFFTWGYTVTVVDHLKMCALTVAVYSDCGSGSPVANGVGDQVADHLSDSTWIAEAFHVGIAFLPDDVHLNDAELLERGFALPG